MTGASGFVGSAVVRLLARRGRSVVALARPGSDLERLESIRQDVRLVHADVFDRDALRSVFETSAPAACIHCAWYVDARDYVASAENFGFVGASIDLALGLARAGCRRFVGIGSCLEYSPGERHLREGDATSGGTAYAASKLALAGVLPQLSDTTGMSSAWARLFFLYGPYEKPSRLVPSVILSLLDRRRAEINAGDDVRDLLHLDDVAAALVAVLDSDLSGPVNVASGSPVTVRAVADTIATALGLPDLVESLPPTTGPAALPRSIRGDNSLLRSTGWRQRTSLEDGIASTIDWWERRRRAAQPTR